MTEKTQKVAILEQLSTFVLAIQTWKQAFIKLFLVIVIFLMALTWYKWDDVYHLLSSSGYNIETPEELAKKFKEISDEQLKIIHYTSGADFSAVFTFRPKNVNYFVDVVSYNGKLPTVLQPDNLGGYPINKTSAEYIRHMDGLYYESNTASVYFPTRDKIDVSYTFSCPYFNIDNVYAGSILMEWYSGKPELTKESLNKLCGQSARILGRIR